jgi:DNA-nicking Smr family endonuclease
MRKVTPEERELFLAALSGRLPVKVVRAVAKIVAAKAAAVSPEPAPAKTAATKPAKTATVKPAAANNRRRATDDEVLLFLEAIGLRAPVVTPAPVKLPSIKPPSVKPRLAKGTSGLDGNTKKKLEKGEIAPSAKLDLHGLTEAAAHGTLLTFLTAAHRRGDRLVLIVTGKGEAGRGVLKQMVPRWLQEAPMQKIIADQRWAHNRHGGDGALYVYLRKSGRG